MAQILKNLSNPPEFWDYFERISKIPRCSGKEQKIREFIKNEAEKFGFETQIDQTGNLLVKTVEKGLEKNQPKVILQCHMDMVCEKNEYIKHDFFHDVLKLKIIEIEGKKWLTAEGTTLGADNGVGIAYLLTLMSKIYSKELKFDPLLIDMLFTVDEEIGLVGAFNIDRALIEGDYLINLDSEEDDTIIIGCAGGINTIGEIKYKSVSINKKIMAPILIKLSVTGLIGGHSGADIHRDRANSIKIINKILWKVNNKYSIQLNSINGGNRANAIPREAQALFFIENHNLIEVKKFIEQIIDEIKLGISKIEPNMEIKMDTLENFKETKLIPENIKNKLLHILYVMPHGSISMHPKIPNLVYTSTNLASIKTQNEIITITTCQRSLHEISKKVMYEKVEALFKLADLNIDIRHDGDYPGWDPDFNAELLKIAKKTYRELFKDEVIIRAIHAGLECGIIKKNFPEIDMIAIGPKVEGAHSPEERLNIKSVEKIWILLIKLLKNFT